MKRRASSELLVSLTLCLLWFSPVSSAQNINTVAGGGHAGGTSKSAFIAYPGGTVRDKAGNTYISSNWGHYAFKLDTKGNVSVVAGKGWAGFGGDGGPATRALLGTFPADWHSTAPAISISGIQATIVFAEWTLRLASSPPSPATIRRTCLTPAAMAAMADRQRRPF